MIRIIAEVAQGYEGRADYCRLYVKAAAKAGADAVKFQIVYADDVAEPGYRYYDWYRQLEMDVAVWREVRSLSRELGLALFTDVSGDRALSVAEQIVPDGIKIHSSNFFNRTLIRRAFDAADRVFVSIGGIELAEAEAFVAEARQWGVLDRLAFLYGFQSEPTPVETSMLSRLPLLKDHLGVEVGYLDHVDGLSPDRVMISAMAMALGADWIEKHLTLSRYLEIEDFVSALEPEEFADYVATLRRLFAALGPAELTLTAAERGYREKAVKKILAARDLPAGCELAGDDMTLRRTDRVKPGQGLYDPASLRGRRLKRAVAGGDPILTSDVE
ncbi:MAG: N-acetylneuraminate synthase family protein [Kiloniellales bacterium]